MNLAAILAHVRTERVDRLLADAVDVYSPPYGEVPVIRVFTDALSDAGVPWRLQPVAGGDPARANILVELGPQPPALLWVGHIDTVPQMHPDHPRAVVRDGVMHGLGTADMKSGCAAAIEAILALHDAAFHWDRGLCVALVVGEEEYGDGSAALLETIHAPLALIGEPTGLQPLVDHYGYLELRLRTSGRRAHAALPEHGDNAIHAMLAWLTGTLEAIGRLPESHRYALNPRHISGGSNLFIIAEECEAMLDVHLSPEVHADEVIAQLDRCRDGASRTHPGCGFEIEQVYWAAGYRGDARDPRLDPLRIAFEAVGRPWETGAFRSHSDANLFHGRGTLPIICGPGDLEVAHTAHESVRMSEVHDAARLYAAIFWRVCGRPTHGADPTTGPA